MQARKTKMDIPSLIRQTLSPDTNVIGQAQRQLEALAAQNWPALLQRYAAELANDTQTEDIRRGVALQIKNNLSSKNFEQQELINQKWSSLDAAVKGTIRLLTLKTLGSTVAVGHVAAIAVSTIATIDLPKGEWRELIPELLQNVRQANNLPLVQSSLDALGYICDGIYQAYPDNPDIMAGQANNILAAVAAGVNYEQPRGGIGSAGGSEVKLKALVALNNSLQFVAQNFAQDNDRNYIMQVVCQATVAGNKEEVKTAALQCLVRIMSLYYKFMRFYMEQALFEITVQAMGDPSDEVRLQAIEFWSTVCDEERILLEDGRSNHQQSPDCQYFAQGALGSVVPKLLNMLYKTGAWARRGAASQDDDGADDDDWNVPKAAATCLLLLAQTVEDSIIDVVIPWASENLRDPNWAKQEAAIMAFGSILDGPDRKNLLPPASTILPTLITMMRSRVPALQDTAAWVVGCISELLPEAIEPCLEQVMAVALEGLQSRPSVANSAAWTVLNLADYHESLRVTDDAVETSRLSVYYPLLVTGLVSAANRPDALKNNLRIGALNALTSLVETSANDCLSIINELMVHYMAALEQAMQNEVGGAPSYLFGSHGSKGDALIWEAELAMGIARLRAWHDQVSGKLMSSDDRNAHIDLIDNICGILTASIRRLDSAIQPHADRLMRAFLTLPNGPLSSKSPSVIEGVIMGIGAVAGALHERFEVYAQVLQGFLAVCLTMYSEPTVNSQAVGLLGDVARALRGAFAPQAQYYMVHLIQMASSEQVQQEVKPHILECFGDIAMAIERSFVPFLGHVMPIFQLAGSLTVDRGDQFMVDFLITLRTAVLEGYAAMVQGTNSDASLMPYVPDMVNVIVAVSKEGDSDAALLKAALGLLGDLAKSYPSFFLSNNVASLEQFAQTYRQHRDSGVITVAQWAVESLVALRRR